MVKKKSIWPFKIYKSSRQNLYDTTFTIILIWSIVNDGKKMVNPCASDK